MARSQARIFVTIWQDEEFVALGADAQRLYLLALSQPQVNFCGVLSFTAKRWSKLARDTSVDGIVHAVDELVTARFVLLDDDTEELWIRSFVRHDGVLRSPNLSVAMGRDFVTIQSRAIREAFLDALPDEFPDLIPEGMTEPQRKGLPEEFRNRSGNRLAKGSGNGSTPARARAHHAEPLSSDLCPPTRGARASKNVNPSGNPSSETSQPSAAPLVAYFVDQAETAGWTPTQRVRAHIGREVKRLVAEDGIDEQDIRSVLNAMARDRKSPASIDLILADFQHERNGRR